MAENEGTTTDPLTPRADRTRLRRLIGRRPSSAKPLTRRMLRDLLVLSGIAASVVAIVRVATHRRPPGDPVPIATVEPFTLKDTQGHVHRPSDWRDAGAVVLLATEVDEPVSDPCAKEVRRLAARFEPQGVLFFGVVPDPSASRQVVESQAGRLGWNFPALLDPSHVLIGELGLSAVPQAAVLDGQGHILYAGPIDGAWPGHHFLQDAILAALDGKPFSKVATPTVGRPIPAPSPLIAEGERITFNKDVAPILWERCAGCHRPGEVGPFSLLTYPDARKRAGFLRDVTAARQMPPWRTVHGYGDFHEIDRLTRRELAILDRWAATGAPEGEPDDLSKPPRFPEGWQLGTPDLVVTMPDSYAMPADGGDIYRAFVIPIPAGRDVAVAAVEFRPGNRRIAHHARFYVDTTRETRGRDEADPMPGFGVWGGAEILKPGLGAWVPGQIPRLPPPGVGKVIRGGSDLVMLIHYHASGKPEIDRSSLGLYYCKTPPTRRPCMISLASDEIDIPPGARRHRMTLTRTVPADSHALSVLPHGHKLLREISLTATLPGGRVVPMLWVDDWDFLWQGQYYFARPVALPKGTKLDVVAYFDNSADNPANPNSPPRRVRFGLASTDEMLGCHVEVIADTDAAQRVYDRSQPFGL